MKKFLSTQKIMETRDDLLLNLVDLIDSKFVSDKERILRDIKSHDSVTGSEGVVFGRIHIHTARTDGISDLCLCASQIDGERIEILVLWNDISEHLIGRLSEIAKFFEKSAVQNYSCERIINELKKI